MCEKTIPEMLDISKEDFSQIIKTIILTCQTSECEIEAVNILFPELNKYQKAKVIIFMKEMIRLQSAEAVLSMMLKR